MLIKEDINMIKKIYAVISERIGADSFRLLTTYDLDKAKNTLVADYEHLTSSERKKSNLLIEVYEVDVEGEVNAEDALYDYFENWSFLDAQDCIELTDFYVTDAYQEELEQEFYRRAYEKSYSEKVDEGYLSCIINDAIYNYVNYDSAYSRILENVISMCEDEDWFVAE